MGVVGRPSAVTGFSAMSRKQIITFMLGRQFRANSSQRAGSFGVAWRLTLTITFFVPASAIWPSLRFGRKLLLRSPRTEPTRVLATPGKPDGLKPGAYKSVPRTYFVA